MKSKLKAAGIHFTISILVISITVGLIFYYLFPDSMTRVSYFREVAMLIILIDLIVGPLLTFIVFKSNKKSLVFDLSSIAIMQIAAFVFGVYSLYQVHPVYITFNIDRFTIVNASEAKPERAKSNKFTVSKFSSPKIVVSKIPNDTLERDMLMDEIREQKGATFVSRAEYYHSYEDNIGEVLAQSLDPKLVFQTEEDKAKLKTFIDQYGNTNENYAYLPLIGDKSAIWVLNKKTAKPIDIISVDPWKALARNVFQTQNPIKLLKKNLL